MKNKIYKCKQMKEITQLINWCKKEYLLYINYYKCFKEKLRKKTNVVSLLFDNMSNQY